MFCFISFSDAAASWNNKIYDDDASTTLTIGKAKSENRDAFIK
jgi:hypothetical protein